MTKSTITRKQLLEIIETDHVQCGEASYLARIALAAMDSEPVAGEARFKEERPRWTPCTAEHVSMVLANPEDWPNYEVRYLYAAPQPAAVVSSEPVAYMYDGEDGTEYNGHNEFSGGGKG